MANRIKEIESLRVRIQKLEQQQEKEEMERQALEDTRDSILDILEKAGLSFDAFIRSNYKIVRRIIAKVDREEAKLVKPATNVKKKTVSKKRRRKVSRKKTTIKIPAGQYTNVPSDPGKVFTVKEKGPRPKALKSFAEEIGLEEFFNQCRVE